MFIQIPINFYMHFLFSHGLKNVCHEEVSWSHAETWINNAWKVGNRMLNYPLSKKFKLIGRCKFNHLIITLTLFLMYELKLPFNRQGP
jgi:hypothetical protein